jgi:hypothetical protein
VSRHRIRSRGRLVTAAFLGGAVAGMVLWSIQLRRSRRDLFNPNPIRRYAALGYISAEPSVESTQILQDYIRWEKKPVLRRRAERVLGRMQARLV